MSYQSGPGPGTVVGELPASNPTGAPTGFGHGRPVILQVIPELVTGGAERGCIDVAAAIARAGGTALVASAGGPMARELERYGARHLTLPLASKNPFTIWRNAARLAAEIRARGVNLIHARSRAPAWSAMLAAKRCGIPFVTTVHAPYHFKGRLKLRYNSVMAAGDRVIAISEFIYRHVQQTYGVGDDRLRLVHRGIDMVAFAPERLSQERVATLARRWNLPEHQRIVLLPGRLTRWKGHAVLLRALAKLGRKDVRALLVGSDQGRRHYRDELEALATELGLQGQVTIGDHCNDMAAAYFLADVVVSASTEPEAFGRVIVEAQAMGRPVIVSAIGAVAETVVAGETGLVVEADNPDALAEALGTVLALDPLERKAIGQDGIRFVRERFTRERMCAETLAVYSELLGGRNADPVTA